MYNCLRFAPSRGCILLSVLLVPLCCWSPKVSGQVFNSDQKEPHFGSAIQPDRQSSLLWNPPNGPGVVIGLEALQRKGKADRPRPSDYNLRGGTHLLYNPPQSHKLRGIPAYPSFEGKRSNDSPTGQILDDVFRAFYKEGDFVKAGERLNELKGMQPLHRDGYRDRMGTAGFSRSQYEKRYAAVQVAAYKEQCEPAVILLAGYCHYQLGHFEEAERELVRYLERGDPSSFGLRLLLLVRSQNPPKPKPLGELKKKK